MKKVILASLAFGALAMASCSNEEMDVKPAGQEGTVTFTASLPASVASRLYSDGQTAKNLQYAVYLAGEQAPLIEGTAVFNNLKATVSTTLATGKSYDILFWAQADDAPYAFNAQTQEVTVTYKGITANNESLDAFFFAEKDLAVNGPVNKTVTLTRPFAQLNIGTNDIELANKAGLEVTKSSVSVTAYETLNLYSGEVSGETAAPVVFGQAAIPAAPEVFPVAGYDYLAMAYILVPADKQTVDVTLSHDGSANAPVFAGVPVQRNYRTNIYGALLTDPAIFNVEINPDYETPDYEYEVVAKTAEDVIGGFASPVVKKITIPENTTIDMSEVAPEALVINSPKTIEFASGAQMTLPEDGFIAASNDLTIRGGVTTSRSGEVVVENGILTNVGDNKAPGSFKSLIHITKGNLLIENMTLINDMDYHYHGNPSVEPYNSSAISYWNDANVTINNSKVYSGEYTICGMGRNVASGEITLSNSYFESNSSNSNGTWSYAMRIFGSKATLENCEVKGVQGGVSADGVGLVMTIKSGKYYTVNTPGKVDAFYPVYITNNAQVVIEGGEFSGANNRDALAEGTSCVVSGNNDVNLPSGSVIIKGGKFSGKAYNHTTQKVYQPESWVALENDAPYLWTVK
ncbi:MAG: hypothetical protein NC391_07720 [Alistipes timonensis]|nr:hypothetical protein [Alistipes timonensis]